MIRKAGSALRSNPLLAAVLLLQLAIIALLLLEPEPYDYEYDIQQVADQATTASYKADEAKAQAEEALEKADCIRRGGIIC